METMLCSFSIALSSSHYFKSKPSYAFQSHQLYKNHHQITSASKSSPLIHRGRISAFAKDAAVATPPSNNLYTVGDFMTKKESLHTVKPTTTVDEALQKIVECRVTGFPVIDDNWNLVGVVSDYDLLALDSISGNGRSDTSMFPEVNSSWKTFNNIQRLLIKTNGKVVGELMTPAPLVLRETTNLEDAARLLLRTKYRRLPIVDSAGRLVGIITRGDVVRAALKMKRDMTKKLQS